MISAYEFLGIQDLQRDTEKILKLNYPNSNFKQKISKLRRKDWWNIWDSLYELNRNFFFIQFFSSIHF